MTCASPIAAARFEPGGLTAGACERPSHWEGPRITAQEFELFRELVRRETGIALRDTKQYLVTSRLMRRLKALGLGSLSEYYDFLMHSDPSGEERVRMINCITTNKTSFFREAHHFDYLRQRLAEGWPGGMRRLRIWSAGCSTGEEPYSIAITLAEALPIESWDVRILATDIDTDVLARAASGVYPESAVEELGAARMRRWFLKGRGEWSGLVQVRSELRKLVSFTRLNLMSEGWPASGLDAVFCRNTIIYFERDDQQKTVERMVSCLKPDGVFFAGHSENLQWLSDRLVPAGPTTYRIKQHAACAGSGR